MFMPRREISESFSPEQLSYLREIYNCCIEELGATKIQLAALASLIFIDWKYKFSEADLEKAKEIQKMIDDLIYEVEGQ